MTETGAVRQTNAQRGDGKFESVPSDRFLTRHDIFDKIVTLNRGMSVLLLDDTFSEARNLVHCLVDKYSGTARSIEIATQQDSNSCARVEILRDESLTDIIVKVNSIRKRGASEVLVHSYLPALLINHPPDTILKYVDTWRRVARESGTVEFYLLPTESFKEVERKLMALLDGAIEFMTIKKNEKYSTRFVPIRCCPPEYNMHEFEYMTKGNRLLIEWEGEFVDKIGERSEPSIEKRVSEFTEKPNTFRIKMGENARFVSKKPYDHILLGQIVGMTLEDIATLFPEKVGTVYSQLARWESSKIIAFERDLSSPGKLANSVGSSYSILNALRLALPDRFVAWQYNTGTKSVPLEYFLAMRKAYASAVDALLEREGLKSNGEFEKDIVELEEHLLEMSARLAALKEIPRHHESVYSKAARTYVPKILRVTLLSGFLLRSDIRKMSRNEYLITIRDCYLCKGANSKSPLCSSISGAVEGVSAMVFKAKSSCEEVRCIAVGDEKCEFRLELE